MMMAKPKKVWVEQAIVVKKSHPFVKSKEEATRIAERHARNGVTMIVESPASFRVVRRPKTCFRTFRSQKRGDHVTVVWGKLKKGAKRSCR
jgi:hypothetical protein